MMKLLSLNLVAAALVGSVVTFGAMYASKTQAQSSTNPFTGSCGGVFSLGSMYDVLFQYASDSVDEEFVSVMLSMNFDTSKVDLSLGEFTIGGSQKFGKDTAANTVRTQSRSRDVQILSQISFTYTAVSGMSNAYEITLKLPQEEKLLMLPVNGGNTFLIQGKTFGASGVCQKL